MSLRDKINEFARKAQKKTADLPRAPATVRRDEGWLLPMMLDAAVPLLIHEIQSKGGPDEDDQRFMREMDSANSNLCLRMEYLMHKGPKEGDTARVFNDTAKVIAILSFCPGGVTLFGRTWMGHVLERNQNAL
jgi:hypothetical protein